MKWISMAKQPHTRSPCAMPSIGLSGVELAAIGLWSSGIWVWWMPGKRFLSECIVPTVKFGGGGKIVLGSLGKALSSFSMTISPCTKRGPYSNGLSRSVWKNLTGLHRALTSTSSNAFEINWNADCEPGLIAQHQCPTSLMPLWLNGSKSPQQCSII